MNIKPSKEITKATGKFPFVMVITSILLRGSIFILVNLPLIVLFFSEKKISSTRLIFEVGYIDFWKAILNYSGTLSSLSIFLLISLILGIILTPIERTFSLILIMLIELIYKIFNKNYKNSFFTPLHMTSTIYVSLLSWFFENQTAKQHWEWQLQFYYIYWSIAFNLILFFILLIIILRFNLSILTFFILIIFPLFFLLFAITHSNQMQKVHNFYIDELNKSKEFKIVYKP